MRQKSISTGFTLLEIAIVLSILGLLTGGVLAGREIIHAAEVHKTIKQIQDINQSTLVFFEKYTGYPGDLRNADRFWPTAPNGNGDGYISTAANSNTACQIPTGSSAELDCAAFAGERAQYFSQLGLAGLGPQYNASAILGEGYPSIKLYPNTGMIVGSFWSTTNNSNMMIDQYLTPSIYLYLGVSRPSSLNVDNAYNDSAIFIPIDANNIDEKIDDGKPLSGNLFGQSYNSICAMGTAANTTPVNATNSYDISSDTPGCNLIFKIGE